MRLLWLSMGLACVLASCARKAPTLAPPRAAGPLTHDAYVWQRAWTPAVDAAVVERGGDFQRLVILAAEVGFGQGRPTVVRAKPDWSALARSGRAIGLGLRIGVPSFALAEDDGAASQLQELAADLVAQARGAGVRVAELQLDFDCPEARLGEYASWTRGFRRRLGDTPLTITALPAWLRYAVLRDVLASTDGFVLQVHSLARPADPTEPLTLCDPLEARRAIEDAAAFGVPFRVALPTYGYVAGFTAGGTFLGLAAEGPAPDWPKDAIHRPVQADAPAIAGLVRALTGDRPAEMSGVIWYRLPTGDDRLNWRWHTLRAVMRGEAVASRLLARSRSPEPGLVEVELANVGDADATHPAAVDVTWAGATLVASDAYAGFDVDDTAGSAARFTAHPGRLSAGETRNVGWLRFDRSATVTLSVKDRP